MPKIIDIDSKEVEMLASFGCSTVEIAKFFGCDESTVRKKYPNELKSGREMMKIKLRQLQWKHASLGNTALLIFLGKQYLGQSEKQEVDFSGNLEAILKECGYVDNPIKNDKKDTE